MSTNAIKSRDLRRDLVSTCPDGKVITTQWYRGARFVLSAQCAQADEHRERVRGYLCVNGLAGWPA